MSHGNPFSPTVGGIRERHATCLNCMGFQGKLFLGIPTYQSMFHADVSVMKKLPKDWTHSLPHTRESSDCQPIRK